jgi:cellulose synthase/poly-beta-1,6-N-acetylglucosamine synthase-like glycosyltransferase
MKIVFWLSLLGIFYTYLGYPALMWLFARIRPKPWKAAPITPSVSIVLAVHNGIALLPRQIEHLLGLDYPNIKEVIIVSDGSTDGTAELLSRQQHPILKTIILEEHCGKAVAVNAGVAEATADVIVFVDIRPEIAPGAIQQLVSNFADGTVGCVCGKLTLRPGDHDAASAAVGGIYWRYEQWLRTCEAVCDSPVGVYGGFYAIRRELAVLQPAGTILDDMFQPLSIIRQGYRSVIDSNACVYDTWPKTAEGEYHRKVRTLAGNFQLFQLAPWTLTPQNRVLFQLFSHKVMRLVVPYLMVLLLVSTISLSAGSPVYAAFSTLQIVGWAIAFLGLGYRIPILHRIAAPASALLVLNVAAVVGLYKFLFTRGPLWRIWNSRKPAEMDPSRRTDNMTLSEPTAVAREIGIGKCIRIDSRPRKEHTIMMKTMRASVIFALGILAGFGIAAIGYRLHRHIDFAFKARLLKERAVAAMDRVFGAKVRAARLEHAVSPAPYFPAGSIWTQDISHAPLDPNSSTMIAWLADAGGWGFGRMQIDFSLRVLQADAKTPMVPFRKGSDWITDSDNVSEVPLPKGGGFEGYSSYECPGHGDCHLIVVDRGQGKLFETWATDYADNAVSANFIAVWNLNRVYPPSGRGDQCTSADAAGFPIAPLLFNADELAVGHIDHAIRFILPNERMRAHFFVHPATHAGAPRGPASAPPYGAHFRLKASYDVSQLMPEAQVVARAMQKYGMFLSDGGNIALTAQSDQDTKAKYADMDFDSHSLRALKVTDFEVVDGGPPIHLTDNCVRNP